MPSPTPSRALALLPLLAVLGCGDVPGPVAPPTDDPRPEAVDHRRPGATRSFAVMTRNLYLGGNTSPLLTLDFTDLPAVLAATNAFWGDVLASDFPGRAAALADEIVRNRPHVVGVQEAVRFLVLDTQGRPVEQLDLLSLLVAELESRGAGYEVVSVRDNTSSALPLSVSAAGVDRALHFTDRIAVLVREDVELVDEPASGNFGATHAAGPVELKRGWIRVEVAAGGARWTVVNTHLEVQALAPVQAAQTAELLASVLPADGAVVLLGDLNSDAEAGPGDPSWTPTWESLLAAGFVDAWEQSHPFGLVPGFTCCHADDLRNPTASFYERIDFVLVRTPNRAGRSGRIPGAVFARLVGDDLRHRTEGGLWPSDHGGVMACLRLPRRPLDRR